MSESKSWFDSHKSSGLTIEQSDFNAELMALTTGIYALESDIRRMRKRLEELTGKKAT
jgi:hypothetical protein